MWNQKSICVKLDICSHCLHDQNIHESCSVASFHMDAFLKESFQWGISEQMQVNITNHLQVQIRNSNS